MDSVIVPVGLLSLTFGAIVDLYAHEKPALGRIRLAGEDRIQNGHHDPSSGQGNGEQGQEDESSEKEQEEAKDEGVPVELEKWWLRVRMRKAALVVVLALLDATSCVNLGWDSVSGAKDTFGIVEDALMVAFWVRSSVLDRSPARSMLDVKAGCY